MAKVLVLGGTGMLGHMVAKVLKRDGHEVVVSIRSGSEDLAPCPGTTKSVIFDPLHQDVTSLDLKQYAYIVNCIGHTLPLIKVSQGVADTICINSAFPHRLAACRPEGTEIYQIATDCVFDGSQGGYTEMSPHDDAGLYGRSKSLGEVDGDGEFDGFLNIRTSIIGPELGGRKRNLMGWFLGSVVSTKGYKHHFWNGVTTLAFARVIGEMIRSGGYSSLCDQIESATKPATIHLKPCDKTTKFGLLCYLSELTEKQIGVTPYEDDNIVDRTLSTVFPHINNALWKMDVPTIHEMILDLGEELRA